MATESENPGFSEDRSTKKVHFKDPNMDEGTDLVVDVEPKLMLF